MRSFRHFPRPSPNAAPATKKQCTCILKYCACHAKRENDLPFCDLGAPKRAFRARLPPLFILWRKGLCRSACVQPNGEKLTTQRRRHDQHDANTGPTPDPNYKRERFATHPGKNWKPETQVFSVSAMVLPCDWHESAQNSVPHFHPTPINKGPTLKRTRLKFSSTASRSHLLKKSLQGIFMILNSKKLILLMLQKSGKLTSWGSLSLSHHLQAFTHPTGGVVWDVYHQRPTSQAFSNLPPRTWQLTPHEALDFWMRALNAFHTPKQQPEALFRKNACAWRSSKIFRCQDANTFEIHPLKLETGIFFLRLFRPTSWEIWGFQTIWELLCVHWDLVAHQKASQTKR